MAASRMDKNAEGYPDPTVKMAWDNMCRAEKHKDSETAELIGRLVGIIKQTAELAGFDIVGRIVFRDKITGKEWR